MVKTIVAALALMSALWSCTRYEQRDARYHEHECPVCQAATKGVCTYCNGSKECMFCKGRKVRHTVIPNRTEGGLKPGAYSAPCTYCSETGVCRYCKGSGKCWTCAGTGKVDAKWEFLNSREPDLAKEQ